MIPRAPPSEFKKANSNKCCGQPTRAIISLDLLKAIGGEDPGYAAERSETLQGAESQPRRSRGALFQCLQWIGFPLYLWRAAWRSTSWSGDFSGLYCGLLALGHRHGRRHQVCSRLAARAPLSTAADWTPDATYSCALYIFDAIAVDWSRP